jgi:hypothetical protein
MPTREELAYFGILSLMYFYVGVRLTSNQGPDLRLYQRYVLFQLVSQDFLKAKGTFR